MPTFFQSVEGSKALSGNGFAMIKLWRNAIVPQTLSLDTGCHNMCAG